MHHPALRHSSTAPARVALAAGALDPVDFGCSALDSVDLGQSDFDSVDLGRNDPDSIDVGRRAQLSPVAQRHGLSNNDASTSAPPQSPIRDAAVASIPGGTAARLRSQVFYAPASKKALD